MLADQAIKAQIERRLRVELPHDTVDVSDGYGDNIHVMVVSRKFDDLDSDAVRQDYLWSLIKDSGVSETDMHKISLLLPLSPRLLQ